MGTTGIGSDTTSSVVDRLAGAPISWGVCEVPGWGVELPVERVLSEMHQLGLMATELGSAGYLPDDPEALRATVAAHGLEMIGGFVPLVLHDPDERAAAIDAAHRAAELMSGAGGTVFVTSPVTTWDWGPRPDIADGGWDHLYEMLHLVEGLVAEYGMTQAIHPHLHTMLETAADVDRVLANTDVGWTLDTGHLLIGGTDPLDFVDRAGDRIRHVHLKDVIMDLAIPVLERRRSIMEGVQAGMFCNLGQGDVPMRAIVSALADLGYDRWFVLEQDAALTDGVPPVGCGPLLDVQASIEFLRSIETELDPSQRVAGS